ncbi:MAG TPA: GNAT family N-acetyltransferase [Chthonomonadales bacterium]|nr:GNAT family N-acetyltransferase [Chthonomonadales bacterium]
MRDGDGPVYVAMRFAGGDDAPVIPLPDGYTWQLWQPRGLRFIAPGMSWLLGILYWVAGCVLARGVPGYGVVVLRYLGATVHRSIALPRFFRHRFLGERDVMVGGTWTHPDHRGRGLASFALCAAVRGMAAPGRRFWYVAHEENTASIRVAERCGFRLAGRCMRTRRLGLRLLGEFVEANMEG